jgi:RNA polymerase sigma-70 factor (ECF subfamily)
MNRHIAGQVARLPENALMNRELKKVLEHALTQLPEKYRVVFVMRRVEDMSVADTMAALSLTESNVKVRLSRARTMLRQSLGSYYRNDLIYSFHLIRCDRIVQNVLAALKIESTC